MKIFTRANKGIANHNGELRDMMQQAACEAMRLNHDFIGTEHLLLALLDMPDKGGARVLRSLSVDPARVRRLLESKLSGPVRSRHSCMGVTARAKRAVTAAFSEARRLGGTELGSEHLLLGLLLEREGMAAHVLSRLGVTLGETRRVVEARSHLRN